MNDRIAVSEKFFRKGHTAPKYVVHFQLSQGGLGDYVGYLSVLEWIAKNHPNIYGQVYGVDWIHELANAVLMKHPNWQVHPPEALTKWRLKTQITRTPTRDVISRLGANCLDLGFIYYAHMTRPPDAYYSQLDLSGVTRDQIPNRPYAIMTPGSSQSNKTMHASAFNGIKEHLISQRCLPVFIGNPSFHKTRTISIEDSYDFTGGLDLIGKTTLLQAAKLMSEAKVVIGIDNGLLHLAAMTEAPIVFGYTISSPEHTMPFRKSGRIYNIHPDPAQLTCTFCSSRMRFVPDVDFKRCIYEDDFCTKFLSEPEPWCAVIERALTGRD